MTSGDAVERIYRWQRHAYDWTRPLFLPGRDLLLDGIGAPDGARLLEVGCGTARNLVRLARRHPDWRLYGLDLSPSMLRTARRRVPSGLRDRILLAEGDAVDWSPERSFGADLRFDAILFSYALSMIPDARRALARAFAALAPGGSLHIVDFAGPETMGPPWSWFLPAWLRLWGVRPVRGLPSLIGELVTEIAPAPGSSPARGDGGGILRPRVRAAPLRGGYAMLVRAAASESIRD